MKQYDSIVIGAGHNGMVCAAMLAKAGQKVLLLERTERAGGLAASREFHPGFSAPVAQHALHFSRTVANELKLESHGLRYADTPATLVGLSATGEHVIIEGDQATGVPDSDRDALPAFRRTMKRYADALAPFWLKTIPRIAAGSMKDMMTFGHIGWNIRRLGKDDMGELLRVFSLPMRDLMDENFESDAMKAVLSWDGLAGSRMAPRSPNNAMLSYLYREAGEELSSSANLVAALEAAISAHGVEMICEAQVEKLNIEGSEDGLKVTGVTLSDGREFSADSVISSADPRQTFLGLAGAENLEIGFTNRIRRLRCNGLVAKMHFALSSRPGFGGLEAVNARLFTAGSLDDIEFALDDSKYGRFSENPVLELAMVSDRDPGLAPDGQHVLSAQVMFVPPELRDGWDEARRAALADAVIAVIERFEPGFRESILGKELLTPADLEARYGLTGGHWHHTEMALDQMLMMRPTYEAAQYSTPLPGLYLCGAGAHPGGDLTGAPGYNAAREILK